MKLQRVVPLCDAITFNELPNSSHKVDDLRFSRDSVLEFYCELSAKFIGHSRANDSTCPAATRVSGGHLGGHGATKSTSSGILACLGYTARASIVRGALSQAASVWRYSGKPSVANRSR